MHGRSIQRILAVLDSKESRRLLECLVAEAFDLRQLRPRPERRRSAADAR